MISGACLCGTIRYEATGPVPSVLHCHCPRCRKHHGAPFASWVEVPSPAFRYLAGKEQVASYTHQDNAVRNFCCSCASVAPTAEDEYVLLPAGNLALEPSDLSGASAYHQFVALKAKWHVIGDELPRFDHGKGTSEGSQVRHGDHIPAMIPADGRLHGSCLCGAVTFSVVGRPTRWMQCHCSRCRRARSAVHGSNMFYPLENFEWITGRDLVRLYRPPEAARFAVSFCSRCGGGTPVEREGVPFVLLPAAIFDQPPEGRPEAHIHLASAAPWFEFSDELPRFAELPT